MKKKFQILNFKFQIPRRSGAGFTLIELLLTIAIVSILMVSVILAINPFEQIKKANDGRRKSDLAELQKALEIYYQDNGSYPNALDKKIMNNDAVALDWGGGWSPYMAILPKDPKPGTKYVYAVRDGNQEYALYAGLERGSKDPQSCGAAGCGNMTLNFSVSPQDCGTTPCSYGVASSNTRP